MVIVNNHKICVHCEDSPPVITEAPVNMTVIAGESVRFECIVTGAPQPTVTWIRGESLGFHVVTFFRFLFHFVSAVVAAVYSQLCASSSL